MQLEQLVVISIVHQHQEKAEKDRKKLNRIALVDLILVLERNTHLIHPLGVLASSWHRRTSSLSSLSNFMALQDLEKQRPLLIVAEDVESDALATLILNKLHAGIKVCAIKAPGFGENRKAGLQDLAVLTGGELITEELGMNLDKVEVDMLGTCKKVTISKDDTIILDGAGDKKAIEERCSWIPTTHTGVGVGLSVGRQQGHGRAGAQMTEKWLERVQFICH